MTFTEIVDEILDRLNYTSAEATTRVGRAVNRLYKSVTTATGLNTTRNVLGVASTITLGQSSMTFTGIEKIQRVYDATTTPARDLQQITIYQMREEPYGTALPKKWSVLTTSSTSVVIQVNTVAQTEFTLYADGLSTVATLSGSQVPVIPESFHDILVEGVLIDEYKKLEKIELARESKMLYEQRLSDLKYFLAKNAYIENYQGHDNRRTNGIVQASGGGSAPAGGTSYTQTGLIIFDRDPSAPFEVTSGSAVVPNLDADKLDGLDSTAFAQVPIDLTADVAGDLPFSNIAQIATDRLLGRDTAGTGDLEALTASGGVEFTGSGGIRRSALTGDVTASAGSNATTIANDAVTYAKMQNVSSVARILGRKTAGAGDVEECTRSEVLDFAVSVAQGDILYRGVSTWENLAAGTNGQVLQTQGAGANPQWASVSSKLFIAFTAAANRPPAAAYATPDTRNSHLVLDFDGTTDEEAVFEGVLPTSYAGGGLTCEIWWAATSATSGTARWQAAIEAMEATDLDSDSFASFQSSGDTTNGTSGALTKTTITFTNGAQMDSLAAGAPFRLKIRRDADGTSGTDDIATDAEVFRVVVRET